jgi:hypothetical protein
MYRDNFTLYQVPYGDENKDGRILSYLHVGDLRNVYVNLVGKPEGKRPIGRPRRRWENIVKIIL